MVVSTKLWEFVSFKMCWVSEYDIIMLVKLICFFPYINDIIYVGIMFWDYYGFKILWLDIPTNLYRLIDVAKPYYKLLISYLSSIIKFGKFYGYWYLEKFKSIRTNQ